MQVDKGFPVSLKVGDVCRPVAVADSPRIK